MESFHLELQSPRLLFHVPRCCPYPHRLFLHLDHACSHELLHRVNPWGDVEAKLPAKERLLHPPRVCLLLHHPVSVPISLFPFAHVGWALFLDKHSEAISLVIRELPFVDAVGRGLDSQPVPLVVPPMALIAHPCPVLRASKPTFGTRSHLSSKVEALGMVVLRVVDPHQFELLLRDSKVARCQLFDEPVPVAERCHDVRCRPYDSSRAPFADFSRLA
mmetsp:Transcript_65589/g.156485  ORF Transcript_65589/g.156485 Transcript_65589/m.156485 type:complete len:218 (+) Transcript_65589:149-802(+)